MITGRLESAADRASAPVVVKDAGVRRSSSLCPHSYDPAWMPRPRPVVRSLDALSETEEVCTERAPLGAPNHFQDSLLGLVPLGNCPSQLPLARVRKLQGPPTSVGSRSHPDPTPANQRPHVSGQRTAIHPYGVRQPAQRRASATGDRDKDDELRYAQPTRCERRVVKAREGTRDPSDSRANAGGGDRGAVRLERYS